MIHFEHVTVCRGATAADDGPEIDESVPHSARIWNYRLGGKDDHEDNHEAGTPIPGDMAGGGSYGTYRTAAARTPRQERGASRESPGARAGVPDSLAGWTP